MDNVDMLARGESHRSNCFCGFSSVLWLGVGFFMLLAALGVHLWHIELLVAVGAV